MKESYLVKNCNIENISHWITSEPISVLLNIKNRWIMKDKIGFEQILAFLGNMIFCFRSSFFSLYTYILFCGGIEFLIYMTAEINVFTTTYVL